MLFASLHGTLSLLANLETIVSNFPEDDLLSCCKLHHQQRYLLFQVYMERCLSQVGIHTLPQTSAESGSIPPSTRALTQQESEAVDTLIAQREEMGLVCRATQTPSESPDSVNEARMSNATGQHITNSGLVDSLIQAEQCIDSRAVRAVAEPQRLSATQQQDLLRRRTGKKPLSRTQLILQVAQNRKKADTQSQNKQNKMQSS